MPFLRKYNTLLVTGTTSIRIPIIKRAVVDFALGADWTPTAGDVKVFVDGAAAANITNLPTAIASGNGAFWEFILTAAELTCKQLLVVVSDAATKAVEDQSFIVETYGDASAMYVTDFSAQLATPTNITAGTITTATNVTTVNGLAANVITAAAINADAITAAKVADDVSTEIANKTWDTDATGHQTQGTFGQAIGDPVADTNTIFKAVVTDAAGATVGVDVVAVKADTAAILIDTAEIGAAGAGLTAINLPDQTMNITGNITGNLSGSVGSVTGAVGSVTAGVSVAAGGISSTSFAAGAIDAAAIAADAITNSELAASAAQEIADEVLNRDIAGGGSGNTRNVRNALRAIRNKVSESGGTLTVTQEDDVTPAWTASVTRTASTDPITAVDPV
jgi:hypothetical protein